MSVFYSYANGIKRATSRPKMVLILWVFNLIFGIFIYFRFSGLLSNAVGASLFSEKLMKGFDSSFLIELINNHGLALKGILVSALLLIVLYFLLNIFLYGGILHSLKQDLNIDTPNESRVNFASQFFQGGGKYYGRFFRLLLYSLPLWIVFLFLIFLLSRVGNLLSSGGENEGFQYSFMWIEAGIAIFLLNLIRMILDYARIHIVSEDTRYVFRSLVRSVGFVFRRPGKTLLLYYLFVVIGIVLFGLSWLAHLFLPDSTLIFILLTLIVGQLFLLLRGWLKIAFQAGQLDFYALIK